MLLSPVSVVGTLVYSSLYSSEYTHCQLSYTGSSRGWKASKAAADECVGYKVTTAQTFYSVEILNGDDGNYLKQFQIEYTLDGVTYRTLPTVYDASRSSNGSSITVNFSPIYAIALRIVVKTFQGWPNFRFEFYYSDANKIVETPATAQE